MAWGPDPEAMRALAQKLGVRILKELVLPDGEYAYELDARTHDRKVKLLAELAEYDGRTAAVRRIAEGIVAGARSTREQIERLHAFVRDNVLFTGEPREIFSSTMSTIMSGAGDCDDSARALMALLRSLDIRAGLRTLPEGGTPLHVATVVDAGEGWEWAETSVDAELGEHPIAAAHRLGIKTRPELGALGRATGGDDEPFEPNARRWNLVNILALGGGIAGALAGGMGWVRPELAGAAVGGAACFLAYDWPLVSEYGDGCDRAFEQQSEACERQWMVRRAAAAAVGAVGGAAVGYAIKMK